MLFIFMLSESPRWLIAHGRPGEVKAFIIKYHVAGDEQSQLVQLEYTEMRAIIQAEMACETG